ncbi:MAG: PAS domain S-box protein [Dehalococcoidia bacterium]|nr:PAS domain S-box protein [Dehalococcoidia bacterium]
MPLRGQWLRPAFGAGPVDPFPADIALRFGLVVFFALYMLSGASRSEQLSLLVGGVILAHALAATLAFRRARRNEDRLLTTWAALICTDIAVISLAALADRNHESPIHLLVFASIFTASAMFEMPFVLALAVLASAGVMGVDVAKGEHATIGFHALFTAALVLFVAGFAGNRSRSEAALRRQLTESEAREREQAAALRRALEAARVSESRFEAISEHAPAILVLYDRRGRPTHASRSLTGLLGLDSLALTRELANSARLSRNDRKRVRAAIDSALHGVSANLELSVRDRAGEMRRLSSTFFPIDGGGGAIALDVTGERSLAAQVARAQQMETVGTLAGGIAHDFNNLLTAILGNLFLIEQEVAAGSSVAQLAGDIRVAGERGADLVSQLLDYSRPNMDSPEPIALERLVEETARLGQRGITPSITLVVEKGAPGARVAGNFGALQQVILNLIINARDAMPAGGKLTISTAAVVVDEKSARKELDARPGAYQVVTVSDTGIGMAPETVARIFDPFFTTKEVGKGTGLGLATSLSILRAHGGWMEVESEEGTGTTFRVMLPALVVEPALEGAEEGGPPPG